MEAILKTNHLTKRFKKQEAVSDLSLTIYKGDIYGFIGRNGAGKTTLIRMVAGLCEPTEGSMFLFGGTNLVKARGKIGTVIESPALYPNMTARENLITECKLKGEDISQIAEILDIVGLKDDRKKAKNFSLGMKQRLAIAVALIGNPELLILDEPTNGLDPAGIREIRDLILTLNQKRKITVLISSHILSELSKFATRYGIINDGKLVEEFTDKELHERSRAANDIHDDDLEEYFLKKIGGL